MKTTRSIAPRRNVRSRVDALEAWVDEHGADGLAAAPPAAAFDAPRQLWPARTVSWSDDADDYPPPPANKFRIEFVDLSFTADMVDVWEDFAATTRRGSQTTPQVAGNLTGCYLPEGTRVWVSKRPPLKAAGKTGRLWIYAHDLAMNVLAVTPTDGIPARGDTLGKAVCDLRVPTVSGDAADGDYSLANPEAFTETIYNVVDAEVAGGVIIKAAREAYAGLLIVDVESCGGT